MIVRGMWGVGDCIAGRAILREMVKLKTISGLETYYVGMYHDLIADGLPIKLLQHPPPRITEISRPPANAVKEWPVTRSISRLTYTRQSTLRIGTQLGAQFASVGMTMPAAPDFSLPLKPDWHEQANLMTARLNKTGKPLMLYRPIARNDVWRCDNRSPDPEAYAALLASIRNEYFVISIADLRRKEWIVNPPGGTMMKADAEFHHGELSFELLIGLFAGADLVFANPGFTPILAQAVGTPVVIVYGGNERFSTTNIVGQNLAPTLAIEPIRPCGCHEGARPTHVCEKEIDVATAMKTLREFVEMYGMKQCAS